MSEPVNFNKRKPDAVFYATAEETRNRTPEYLEKAREAVKRAHAKRMFQEQLRIRREFHAEVLNRMEVDFEFAQLVKVEAHRRIALWRSAKTCSEFYPTTWEKIMRLESVTEMRKAVLDDPEWSNALQQNSAISGLYIHQLMESE